MLKQKIENYLKELYKKYGYRFNAKFHSHSVDSIKLQSVTGFINSFGEPFNAKKIISEITVNPNSEYYQLDSEFIQRQWQSLAVLGTKMHHRAELWLQNKINDTDFQFAEYFRKNNLIPENCLSEVSLFNLNYLLGGIADTIQILELDDKIQINVFDIKTTKNISENYDKQKSASLQIYIYSLLLKNLMQKFKFEKPLEIKCGQIISIESNVKDIRKEINTHDLTQFKEPILLNLVKEQEHYDFIKNEMLKRKQ
jgi:predicted patatin/cPLA2 family phospholipase